MDVEVDCNGEESGEESGEEVEGPRGEGRKEDERPEDENGPNSGKGPRVVEVRKEEDEVATRIGGGDEIGIPVEDRLLTTMLEP